MHKQTTIIYGVRSAYDRYCDWFKSKEAAEKHRDECNERWPASEFLIERGYLDEDS